MSGVTIDCLTLPVPGRYIQPHESKDFSTATNIQVSINQVLRNRDAALQQQQQQLGVGRPLHVEPLSTELKEKIKAGKDLVWTTDVDVELPVKVAESGPAAIPAQTVVEFFADCVRRFGSEPALLFEPHYPCSSSSSSSSSSSGNGSSSSGNGSAAAAAVPPAANGDDGGTQCVCFPKGSSTPLAASPPSYVPNLLPGWCGYSWFGYWTDACFFAKALLHLGAPRLCRVAIMGCNSPAWAISFYGTIISGGISVGVYTTNNEDACKYVIEHSQCFIAVVDSLENAHKMLAVREHQLQQQQQQGQEATPLLPGGSRVLQQIVVYRDRIPASLASDGLVVSFDDFLASGRAVKESALSARMERQKPGACCCIVYTSGTTGPPKGVMLSHDNLTWTASLMAQIVSLSPQDRIVSLLPLSHVAAQIVDLVAPLIMGTSVYFARPDVLRGTLLYTLLKVRPTWFLGVPRIWEKIEQKLKEFGARGSHWRRRLSTAAKEIGYEGACALLEGRRAPWAFTPVNKLVLHQVRKALGFDKCNAWGSCAAPIDPETQKYFLSLGMPINSLYGLSESTGPQTFIAPSPGWFKVGSIGHSLPGTDTLILNPNSEGEGEICFRGRNIFMGYLGDDKATMEAVDPQGFLHSGDLGRVDKDGFIFITGRAKELLITAGGENVAPVLIESTIRQELPFVSNCMVVGDRKKFLSVLICLHTEKDKDDAPTEVLAEEVLRVIEPLGSTSKTTAQAAEDPVVNKLVLQGLERANKRAVSRAQRVLAWRVLPVDFSVAGGELTATLKLRRKVVTKMYEDIIDQMYLQPHPPCLQGSGAGCKL
ncbi:very long-chain acyl-CoA synthetase, putative [Eimeria necatrix]|uniref:Very long-chain acyl-CoA synthetase, putative n=1 Tax=Eimeria necatrix TaxID=51315 RepID=U6MHT2_9EIME|nr:very long-chain acyl-CoA synthetase, putative [Eimeria necatrix]CDJ62618.1 very long-chain acyl-CoA synthetase, putative [Eimeria necatrix]